MTIWFDPCLRISGPDTPSLSTRLRMMSIDRLMSSAVNVWPFGGFACSTTSRPPCRSRPWRSVRWIGEPGQSEQKHAGERRDHQRKEEQVRAA